MKKEGLGRTKVVIRHLPPSLSQFHLFSQFDHLFSHRYNWHCFRPGKLSPKNQRYSRAYIGFKCPGDAIEFAEFFHGHIFINEKGAQFKAIVEYAPSQRIPKYCIRKDGLEGTVYQDPEYLEFLKLIAEPVQTLPSAEVQYERKEVEQSGSAKEVRIITPLMEFVRNRRTTDCGKQAASVAGRRSKKAGSASLNKPNSEKKKDILNRSRKKEYRKGKSTNILAPRQKDQPADLGGERDQKINTVRGDIVKLGNPPVSTAHKQKRIFTASVRSEKGMVLNDEASKVRPMTAIKPRNGIKNSNNLLAVQTKKQLSSNGNLSCAEPPQPISHGIGRSSLDENLSTEIHHSSGSASKREEKLTRNRGRRNHGVPSPLSLSDIHHDNGTILQHTGSLSNSNEGGPTRRTKKYGSLISSEQRSTKGDVANGHAGHEKQVWVQKSPSCS